MSAPLPALTDTWNAIGTAFTAIKMTVTDTASAVGSKLLDLIVGSTHMFQVGKNGHSATGPNAVVDGTNAFGVPQYSISTLQETVTQTDKGFNGNYIQLILNPATDTTFSYTATSTTLLTQAGVSKNFDYGVVNAFYDTEFYGSGHVGGIWGVYSFMDFNNATIDKIYGYASEVYNDGGATVAVIYGFWQNDLTGVATNPYAFWYDGPGVARIKEDGATRGAVYAWYNPNFTKYTPGAVNFERGVLRWNTGDVLEIGAEAGGTGTLRKVRHLGAGHIFPLANLPTSDPGVAGQLFTSGAPSAGVPKALMISGG